MLGAMAVFTSREAAERFAQGDPFRTEGIVAADYEIREWNAVIAPGLSAGGED
jgi:uncharacterized protein YciI